MHPNYILILILTVMCGAGFVPSEPQAQAERAKELQQTIDLSAQVLKLYGERKFNEALPLAQRVLEMRSRLLPQNDLLIGEALINLGEVYLVTNKLREAEDVFQEALRLYETQAHPEQMTVSRLLNSLAYLRIRKHDFDRADPLLLKSLEIQEKELGHTNPTTIEAMKDYACLEIRSRADKENLLLAEKDEAKMKLRARAVCWLGGLLKDCSVDAKIRSENVVNGKALHLVQPAYPSAARQKHISGTVFIAVLIDENGNVIGANPVCGGPDELNTASLQAARQSRFSTTKVNNEPMRVTGLIVYRFIAN
jgi:TonB family protein